MSLLNAPALPASSVRRGLVKIDSDAAETAASTETVIAVAATAAAAAAAAAGAVDSLASTSAIAEAASETATTAISQSATAQAAATSASMAAAAAVAAAAGFPVASFRGTIVALDDDPGDPAANAGAWWQIGVEGTLSHEDAGGLVVAIGDRILCDGNAWIRYLTPPTYIPASTIVTPMYSARSITPEKLADGTRDLMARSYIDAPEDEAVTGFLVGGIPPRVALGVDRAGRLMIQGQRYGREDLGYSFPGAATEYRWGWFTPGPDGRHRTILAVDDAGLVHGPHGLIGGDQLLAGDAGEYDLSTAGGSVGLANVQESPDGTAWRFFAKPSLKWLPYRMGKSGNGYRPRYTPADLNHVLLYGQSNATRAGNESGTNDALTTTPHARNLMFGAYVAGSTSDSGLMAPQDAADSVIYRAGGITAFRALFEGTGSADDGETMASGIVNTITARLAWKCVASSAAVGGYTISQLAQGEWPYLNLLYQVTRAKQLTNAAGGTYKVAAIAFIQGEADATSSTWHTDAIALCNDLNADIQAITGQVEDVLFIIEQLNRPIWTSPQAVDVSILSAHHGAGGRIYWQAPRYDYVMGNHYYPHGKRRRGCHIGETLAQILGEDHEWEGLRLKSHAVAGSSLFLRFHVPVRPLAFTTSDNVPSLLSLYGFEADGLTTVDVAHDDMLVLTNSGGWSGKLLRYARQSGLGAQKGNLSDSQAGTAIYTDADAEPYGLRNWCAAFDLQL